MEPPDSSHLERGLFSFSVIAHITGDTRCLDSDSFTIQITPNFMTSTDHQFSFPTNQSSDGFLNLVYHAILLYCNKEIFAAKTKALVSINIMFILTSILLYLILFLTYIFLTFSYLSAYNLHALLNMKSDTICS